MPQYDMTYAFIFITFHSVLTSRMHFSQQILNFPLCRLLNTVGYGWLCGPHVTLTRRF